MEAVPFKLTRESRIRIDREGRVWHEGERVDNPRLAHALASWIDWDSSAARWILRNSVDWCYVTVDDTPYVVRAARLLDGDAPRVDVERSDGVRETLHLDDVFVDPEGPVYAYVRGGSLLARFDRAAAFALLDNAEDDPAGGVHLRFGDRTLAVHTLEPETAPPYVRSRPTDSVPPAG